MKIFFKLLLLVVVMGLLTIGCAKEITQEEMAAAKAIVQDVVDAGQGKYAQAEIKKLGESLNAALREVEAKNYKKAKEMLPQIKPMAEGVKSIINDEQDLLKALKKNKYYVILVKDKTGVYWAIPVDGINTFREDKLAIKANTIVGRGEGRAEDMMKQYLINLVLKYKSGKFGLQSFSFPGYASGQLTLIKAEHFKIIVHKVIYKVKKK
jgi:uncharacterized protein YqiB (DUF1249 family)